MMSAIVPGSQSAVAKNSHQSLAESFLSAEMIILLDCSGSMDMRDAPGNISRKEAASNALRKLQAENPGKIALICFADRVEYAPHGSPVNCGGGTAMDKALEFAKIADDCGLKIVIVSDGLPNDEQDTLRIAKTYTTKIDAIYIGSEQDYDGGRAFLQKLVGATRGQFYQSDAPGMLGSGVERLLLGG